MNAKNIMDFFEEYNNFNPEIIERELKIEINSNFITTIIGPRRSGKTYYLLYLRKLLRDPLYLNFEDSRLIDIDYKDLRNVIRLFKENYYEPHTLLLDEIQNLKGWEIIIRELHDLKKYNIIITGSSSKLLSKEVATQLRGRTITYLLLPFSFREYIKIKNIEINLRSLENISDIKKLLKEYLEYGGFPDVTFSDNKTKILKEYSDLILFRDFIERYKIKNLELARFLHNFLLSNFSEEISINSIYNKIKSMNIMLSKNTIYNYITKMEDTIYFFLLDKYSNKIHIRKTWPKKIYICDTGLSKTIRFSEDIGKLMENIIYLELLRKTNINPLLEIYYFKDYQQHEIDFLVKEGNNIKQLIQVSYINNYDEIDKREIRSLLKGYNLFNKPELLIITWDYEDNKIIDNINIKFIPLYKWLLNI
ncbi:AAA+ superfamily ATPase [Nanobdella aerobiophila]|uniref:AAA+ superfamily ATPase n=1 Tax=Nanobdella aerobiophila TaxID=2586965 RepID=A0A915WT03_9ARCH|nr:ATP-binding protein [Nanobdella aerobiophila]BBL45717.1 AAA+ superfamily ATPase [Nanobdella aerobiophila]